MQDEAEGLTKERVQAEIAHLRAQTATEEAQAAKLNADRQQNRRSFAHWVIDVIKILLAGVIGIGGVVAAITGYSLKEVQKAQMELQINKLQEEVERQKASLAAGKEQDEAMKATLKLDRARVAEEEKNLDTLRKLQIAAKAVLGGLKTQALDNAIAQTQHLQRATDSYRVQLGDTIAKFNAARLDAQGAQGIYAQIRQDADRNRAEIKRTDDRLMEQIERAPPSSSPYRNPRPHTPFDDYIKPEGTPSASPKSAPAGGG